MAAPSHYCKSGGAPTQDPKVNPNLLLGDVDDVVRAHPGFTTPAVRALSARSKENGLNEHIYRIGRRVMLDLNGFQRWVLTQKGRQGREAQG